MRSRILTQQPWVGYLLPLAVFLAAGSFEPTPEAPGGRAIGLAIPYGWYPAVYVLKVLLTAGAIAWVWPVFRSFPFRLSPRAVLVGVVGAALWIGLCRLRLEQRLLEPLGLGPWLSLGARSGFNPLVELSATPGWAWTFLAIRMFGLALLVPLAEEFFLRGWVMRFCVDAEWWNVPFGTVNRAALVVGTVFPMLMHPAELFAAAVWFSLVTWLMVKTRSIWDCVLAHALTNLALGVYVVLSGHWELM